MKHTHITQRLARGFTMVELMIAMVLSLFLLGGITYVVVNSNKNYNTTDSLSRLQENARFAMGFIMADLRRAGYLGCANDVDSVHSTLNGNAYGTSGGMAINPIEGTDNIGTGSVWSPSGTAVSFTNSPIAGSDAFSVRYLDLNNPITIVQDMPNESGDLFVNVGSGLQIGDIIAITDCNSSDILQITGTNTSGSASGKDGMVHNSGSTQSPGNSTQKLSKSYNTGSKILKFKSYAYYVGTDSGGRSALFRVSPSGTEELVEGVDSMQVLYGEVTSSDRSPTRYSVAASVGDWQNVISVRIGLLLTTVANTANSQYGTDTDTGSYDVNGQPVNVPSGQGRKLRRVFVSTAMLRNVR